MTQCCFFQRLMLQRILEYFHYHLNLIYLFLHQTNLICGAHIFLDVCPSTGVWLISKNLYSQRKLIISLLAIISFQKFLVWGGVSYSSPIFMIEFGLTLDLVHAVMTTLINTCSCLAVSRKLNILVIICFCFFNSSSSSCVMIPKLQGSDLQYRCPSKV